MKKKIAACIIILGLVVSPLITLASPSQPYAQEKRLLTKKLGINEKDILISWNEKIGTPSLLAGSLSSPSKHSPQWITYKFLRKLRSTYGLRDPNRDLKIVEIKRTADGQANLKLQQMLFKTPVYGATLAVQINRSGVISRVEGNIYPHLEREMFNRAIYPAISRKEAIQIAIRNAIDKDLNIQQEPDVQLYYYPLSRGTQLIYEVSFKPDGSPAPLTRTKVHALRGYIIL